MRVVVAAALFALLMACSDDKPPASRSSSAGSAASLSSEQVEARSLARVLADGLQEGAAGRMTTAQSDCLVDEIAARVPPSALESIGSTQPDPRTLPRDVRTQLGQAFDVCLPRDMASALKQQLGP